MINMTFSGGVVTWLCFAAVRGDEDGPSVLSMYVFMYVCVVHFSFFLALSQGLYCESKW